jgi:type II secretory pathway pseudopilin PulG
MYLNKRYIWRHARDSHAKPQNSHAAFTLLELLAVVAVAAFLIGMMLPALPRRPRNGARIKCVNNLKNIGLAFRIYASDNSDHFPWEIPGEKGDIHINYLADPANYIRAVTNELSTPRVLVCPADNRTEATNWTQSSRTNLTYFISPDASATLPDSFLAGDRNITNEFGVLLSGLRILSRTNYAAGWDKTIHKYQGDAGMADGSVQQLSSARLREQLRNTGQPNQRIQLSIP